jgi:hypothetical protein
MTSGRIFVLLLTVCAGSAWAQADETETVKRPESREDTHILGIVPDYDTVRNSNGVILPISAKTKFWLATEDVFDPFSFVITGIYAGISQWTNQYPEWGQGAKAYGKRYGGAFGDNLFGNYMTEGVWPVVLHQDPRYFRMGPKYGFWKRVGYSATRVIVTRGDSGARQFNFSEIIGNGAAAFGSVWRSCRRDAAGVTGHRRRPGWSPSLRTIVGSSRVRVPRYPFSDAPPSV